MKTGFLFIYDHNVQKIKITRLSYRYLGFGLMNQVQLYWSLISWLIKQVPLPQDLTSTSVPQAWLQFLP